MGIGYCYDFVSLEICLLLKRKQTFITEFKQSIFISLIKQVSKKAFVMRQSVSLISHIIFEISSESLSNFPYLF